MTRTHTISIQIRCDDKDYKEQLVSIFRQLNVGPDLDLYSNGSGMGGNVEKQSSYCYDYKVDIPKLSEHQQKINAGEYDDWDDQDEDDFFEDWGC